MDGNGDDDDDHSVMVVVVAVMMIVMTDNACNCPLNAPPVRACISV